MRRKARAHLLTLTTLIGTLAVAPTVTAQAPELLLARSDGGASLSALLKYQVEINDPIRFAMTKEKALKLRKEQRDSMRNLQRITDRDRNRVMRELERRHSMTGGTDLRTLPLTTSDIALVDSVMSLTQANWPHVLGLLDSTQLSVFQAERAAFQPRPLPPERRAFRVTGVQPPPMR